MDDLYNNLKVYKVDIKGQSSSGSNSHNVACVSSKNTSSINETVNATHDIPTARSKEQPFASSYADDVMFSLFTSQSNTPRLDNKDLEQIDTDDLEEMNLKWNQGNRSADNERRVVSVKTHASALVVQDGLGGYNWSYQAKEGPTDFALILQTKQIHQILRDISIKDLKNQLEETMKEKDDLKEKLTKFEESSKNLTRLINSQMSANDKTGLRYDSQLSENEMPKCEIFETASDSRVNVIDEDNNQAKDRYEVGIGYHAVPPPYTGNYMPQRADLSFVGLDDSVFTFKISETRTSVNENESIASMSSEEIREKPKTVREVRPVWNNAKRVNHHNFSKMTHPHPKRNFVPTAVATKSGQVLVNAAKQNLATSTSTVRPKINTAAIRPYVNAKYSYFKPHFPKRRYFNQRSAAKTNTFLRKINTAKGKNVTTAGPKAVVNAAEGKKENALREIHNVGIINNVLAMAKVKKVNDKKQIRALVDKMKVIITEDSIRSDLHFDDAEGTACLLNEAIFKDKQVEGMARHKELYIISSHTKKFFANMRRIRAGFSGEITPLFDTMMVQAPEDMEVSNDETKDEDQVPTPSIDPLPSGEDSSILNELMVFCTSLQEQILDLQEAKAAQAQEIDALKKKVTKLNKWRKSRSRGLRRLKKVDDLNEEEVVMETTTGFKDSVAPTTDVTKDEVTMAQALAALKSTKPKVVIQEQEMSTTIPAAATIVTTAVPTPRAKDEEYARKLEAKKQEATRLSRAQQDEEANNYWDNMQAMMDADRLLAKRLQAREREEFFEVEKARLEMTKVNNFIAMDSEAQESSTKRTAEHLKSDISKKQKVDENVEPVVDDSEELRKYIEIVPDDGDEVLIEVLWDIAKDIFKKEKPVDHMDNILFRTLKTMFEHHFEDTIWKYQQGLAKVYPLIRNTLHQLWSDVRLQVDYDVEMAYDLLRFIIKQLMEVSAAEELQLLEEFLLSNG
nr:hypothetical protein [Tanacetum cinerariifolium]